MASSTASSACSEDIPIDAAWSLACCNRLSKLARAASRVNSVRSRTRHYRDDNLLAVLKRMAKHMFQCEAISTSQFIHVAGDGVHDVSLFHRDPRGQ